MPIDFPNSPTLNQVFTVGTNSWTWNGTTWNVVRTGVTGPTGPQGPQGIQGLTGPAGASGGITLSVTNSGSGAYVINGSNNPTLSFIRGHRYVINVNASGHPFWIQTVPGAYSSGNVYSSGVTNNGEDVGSIIFEVPFNAPALYYACEYHSSMAGAITVSDLGPQGLQGIQGIQGPQGIQGIQGETGPAGSGGGVWSYIGQVSSTGGSTVSFSNLNGAYKELFLTFSGVYHTTSNRPLFKLNNSTNFSDYDFQISRTYGGTAYNGLSVTTTLCIPTFLAYFNGHTYGSGSLRITNANSTGSKGVFLSHTGILCGEVTSTIVYDQFETIGGSYNASSAINSINISTGGGTWGGGTWKLWGAS